MDKIELTKEKWSLTTEEMFELTTGVLGHLVELEQLHYLKRFIDERIKFLKNNLKRTV